MPDRFHYGRITDAVHGTFGISELESDIISTPVFQRLHNVRQLGLAHLVYPGAEYSRFAHSLGACHVAARMVRSINQNCAQKLSDDEMQMYRLTGLLHDLGHYPFSHAMEYVALDHYKGDAFLTDGDTAHAGAADGSGPPADGSGAPEQDAPPPAYHHEALGRAVIRYDSELGAALNKHGFSTDDLRAILSREKAGAHTNLFSSDLDCDRLDYLMRTAHCAGLPYGKVDVEYITTQICIDSEGHLCLTKKALRAADHLLMSRYYDYLQVAFHKTVVALEIVLRDVMASLLKRDLLDCSGATIKAMIGDGRFASFDDQYMIGQLRQALPEIKSDDPLRQKLLAVLMRRPPKLVASHEAIGSSDKERRKLHKNLASQLRDKMNQAADKFGIDRALWHAWDTEFNLTKIGSRIPLSDVIAGNSLEEEIEQAVRILTTEPDAPDSKSKLLVEHDFALMKQLSQSRFYAIRIFVHIPDDRPKVRAEIEQFFQTELPDFPFAP